MDTVTEKVFIRFFKRFHFTQYFSNTAHFIWDLRELLFYDFHWAWLGLGKKLNWFPVLMNSLLSVKSLQRRQRIRIIFQQFHQCRSPPPCPPPSARPYSSWRRRQIRSLGEMKPRTLGCKLGTGTLQVLCLFWYNCLSHKSKSGKNELYVIFPGAHQPSL